MTGEVISGETRAPLLGVNIAVQNTDIGTTTDLDGQYVLEGISPQDILVFTYIGYQDEEVAIDSRGVIDIVLTPQALSGEDVVVIGYGTVQRRDITSSIFSLKEGSFTQGAVTDIQALLQARVPGVLITQSSGELGAEPLIRIRGGTSVSASNAPLIVIDGVPIDNNSATPSFGVTSRGGEVNDTNPSGGVRDNVLSMLNPNDIASIDVLKDASAAAIYGARGGNGVILITTKEGKPGGVSLTYDGYTSSSSVTKTLDLLTASEYKAFAEQVEPNNDYEFGSANTDWQDQIFRTGTSQSHNVAFAAGTQQTRYRVSLNYLDEEGIVLGSDRQRISGRLNINHNLLDEKLRLALRINPTYIKRHDAPYRQTGGFNGGMFTNVYKMNPTFPVYLDDGSYYDTGDPARRNPVALANEIDNETSSMRIFANATADYEFLPGLSAKVNLGLDRTDASRSIYQPRSLLYMIADGGRADIRDNRHQSVLFETTLNYRTAMGLEAWAGYTFQEFEIQGSGATARDFVTDAWSFNALGGGADFSVHPFSFREVNRLVSFLGRVNYNPGGKFLVSGALRREGSSRFGAENKWGVFPSASAGFRVTDDLKVRASWGITGNQDIGNLKSLVILGAGANAVVGGEEVVGVAATQLANPDLKWEETSQLNLGVDFNLYRDRLSGSVDAYTKSTTDLLLEFAVPQPAVVETRLANAGEVTNKGFELLLNTVNMSTSDLFWKSSFNFAINRNEVVTLGDREFIIYGRVNGAGLSAVNAQIVLPGEPLGTFFGPKFLGYDSEGNERITTDADEAESTEGPLKDGRFILGKAQPDFTWGFSNTINYNDLDFSVFIQGVQGIDILNNTRLEYQRPDNVRNGINLFAEARDDVKAGQGDDVAPSFTDRFIEDGSFIRLQNITVGYTFRTATVRSLRLYVSADNLFVLTGYKGYDPEVNTFDENDNVATTGIDYTNYPRARTFTIGLSLGL